MDFDPRDYDSRDDERHVNPSRGGSRDSSDERDRDDDWRQTDVQPRDREDRDARTLGRGPGTDRQADGNALQRHDDARWAQRYREHDHQQAFYAGLVRARELEHDVQIYRAYEQAEARLRERGAHIDRVVLDHELKSEYQRWLHERDKDHDDYDGHPDRTVDEIRNWAHEHDLPHFDDEVHFPDVRIEYQEPDGRWDREDIEVT